MGRPGSGLLPGCEQEEEKEEKAEEEEEGRFQRLPPCPPPSPPSAAPRAWSLPETLRRLLLRHNMEAAPPPLLLLLLRLLAASLLRCQPGPAGGEFFWAPRGPWGRRWGGASAPFVVGLRQTYLPSPLPSFPPGMG